MRDPMATPGWWAERLRQLREERGWRQEDLAERAGITQAQISRLESGDQIDPRMTTLLGLADAFGMTVDALLGRRRAASDQDGVATRKRDSNNLKAAAGARIEAHLAGALASLAG